MKLEGRVAIVTGAGQGIGRADALAFVKEGAKVVILDITDKIYDVKKEIEAMGGEALAIRCDVSNKEQVDSMVKEALNKYGRIDILVNNAGTRGARKEITELEEEEWEKTISVDLKGTFLCSKAVIPTMIKQKGGKIINNASISGEVTGYPKAVDYCAAKGGMVGLTKALTLEVGKYGINVNAIAPGAIETELTTGATQKHTLNLKTLKYRIPLRRTGKPEDVANLIIFLSSNESDYITGQVIVIDGGWTQRLPWK